MNRFAHEPALSIGGACTVVLGLLVAFGVIDDQQSAAIAAAVPLLAGWLIRRKVTPWFGLPDD